MNRGKHLPYPTRWYDLPKVSSVESLQVYCPKCGAVRGEPCVYVQAVGNQDPDCVGKPTKVTHNDRRVQHSKERIAAIKRQRVRALRDWLLVYGDIFKE